MLPYRDSRLTKITIGVFFLIVVGYTYFEARGILFGPSIRVDAEKTVVNDPLIIVHGQADRIASLTMNGKAVTVTETGIFDEPYLLAPGQNRIVLDASDRYGHKKQHVLQIVYTPAGQSPLGGVPATPAVVVPVESATSTASTTPVAQ
ncbi:MAG: hypothetical protein WC050_01760 [Candidatus Paceibacterota bacterium]